MIIQLRGTSGSGKTTAMRKFMGNGYIPDSWTPIYVEWRRKPMFYGTMFGTKSVAVLGHYESICGGCDTFKGYGQLQEAVAAANEVSDFVVMEGLMLSDDVLQTIKMHEAVAPVKIIYLTTDLLTCIERVKSRRAAKGKGPEFNEKKLRDRHAQIERTRPRLEAAGIYCRRASDEQAVKLMLEWVK